MASGLIPPCTSNNTTAGSQFSMFRRSPHYSRLGRFAVCLSAIAWVCSAGSTAAWARSGAVAGASPTSPPTIDGRLDDAEWASMPGGEGFVDHQDGRPAPRDAKFWLGYDEHFVYFAARLACDPGQLSADEFRNNASLSGNDSVSLKLDTFGTLQDANRFTINPRGASSIAIAGGRAAKAEWLGEIASAGRITPTGWEVEARIPWGIMPLPAPGARDLRFNVDWYTSVDQRQYSWRYTQVDKEAMGAWRNVEVPRVGRARSMRLLPYVYGAADRDGAPVLSSGLDLKTALGPQAMLVGTVSPDFRNIENQILSVDFSYFEKLAGESRPFFQEGADYRNTGYDHRLFASQRLGSFDWGLNAYGSIGDRTRFGALATVDAGDDRCAVASLTHKADRNLDVSGAFVSFQRPGAVNNSGQLRVDGRYGAYTVWAGTQMTSDQVEGQGFRNNVGFGHDSGAISFNMELAEITSSFYPRAGYSPERDLRGVTSSFQWFQQHPRGGVMESAVGLFGTSYGRCGGGKYRDKVGVSTSTTWRDGTDLDLTAMWEKFLDFDDRLLSVSLERPRNHPTRHWQVDCSWGVRQEQDYRDLSVGLLYRPWRRMQVNVRAESVRHFDNREQIVGSFNLDLDKYQSIGGRIVRYDDKWNGYVSFRRSGGRGSEFYVILGDPNAETFQTRLTLKANWPLEIRY